MTENKMAGRKKFPLGSHINSNTFFVIMLLMCAAAAVIFFQIKSPANIFTNIRTSNETDLPVFLIALITLFAAAMTVWISWLIKEEAREISLNLEKSNKDAHDRLQQSMRSENNWLALQKNYLSQFETAFLVTKMQIDGDDVVKALLYPIDKLTTGVKCQDKKGLSDPEIKTLEAISYTMLKFSQNFIVTDKDSLESLLKNVDCYIENDKDRLSEKDKSNIKEIRKIIDEKNWITIFRGIVALGKFLGVSSKNITTLMAVETLYRSFFDSRNKKNN